MTRFAGRYELRRVIGHGGMGTVYEAEQVFTGQSVALKVITAGVRDREGGPDRFLREARAPSSIGHPAIVNVVDAAHDEHGTPYIAFELIDGESLAAALAAGRLSGADVLDVAIEVLDALDAAHRAGFVHRDLKPQNVMVLRDGQGRVRAKLLDFGIARQLDAAEAGGQTATGAILGTPDFMSPEQARGERVDGRADLYGVGAVLFYALAGRPPFAESTLAKLIMSIASGDAPPLASVAPQAPGPLAEAIDRALRSDPAARWPSAAAMRDALALCRGNSVVGAIAPPPAEARSRSNASIERLGSTATLPSAPPAADAPLPATALAPDPAAPAARRRRSPLVLALAAAAGFALLGGLTAVGVLLLVAHATQPRPGPAVEAVPGPAAAPADPLPAPIAPPLGPTVVDKPPAAVTPPPISADPVEPELAPRPSKAPAKRLRLERSPSPPTSSGLGPDRRSACDNVCTRRCGIGNSGCLPPGGLPSAAARNACAAQYEGCLARCTCP